MRNEDSHRRTKAAAGMLGGLLGTAALQSAFGMGARLPQRGGRPATKVDPAEFVVSRFEQLRGRRLPRGTRAVAKRATHWLYGLGWAGALTTWAPRLRMNRLSNAIAAGAGLGLVTWAAGHFGWLPAGIVRPAAGEEPSKVSKSLLGHVAYGVFSALPLFAAEKVLPARRPALE